MTSEQITKASAYLSTIGALNERDEQLLARAAKTVKKGKPLCNADRMNVEDLLFLYKGMTD